MTKCEHYFCEKCALAHFKKSSLCFVCGKATGGVFNPAKEIAAKIAEKKRQEAENEQSDDGTGDVADGDKDAKIKNEPDNSDDD